VRHSYQLRSRVAAWSLAGFTVPVLVAALVLAGLDASRMTVGRVVFYGIAALAVVVYAGAGRLIASRVPGNAVGWLLGLTGMSLAASLLTEQYALYGLATAPGTLPAARLAGWCSGTFAALTIALLLFLILLFPDGRLPSRRWRPVLWAMFAAVAGWVAGSLQVGTTINGGLTSALSAAKVSYPNPLGILPEHGWFGGFTAVIFVLEIVTGALVAASVFARRRGASAELRKQLAWLGYVALLTAIWFVVLLVDGSATNAGNSWLATLLYVFLVLTPVAGIPLACMAAVLKYRLYEIDRIISRTLAYAIVSGLLVGVYAGLVLLATEVLTIKSPVAVAASTLAAAALFSPLRRRVQQIVDRRFNRARYDADQTVTAFAARLKDAVDLDSVRDDLAGVVQQALEPAHISVWVSRRT
jgi:MFS family permease